MASNNPTNDTPKSPETPNAENGKKDEHYYERWKNPGKNKMGNDITGDMKIANSNGELEGGKDKEWHMEDGDQE